MMKTDKGMIIEVLKETHPHLTDLNLGHVLADTVQKGSPLEKDIRLIRASIKKAREGYVSKEAIRKIVVKNKDESVPQRYYRIIDELSKFLEEDE